jgi:hypothetical protein
MSKKEVLVNYGEHKFRLVRTEQIFQISGDGEETPRDDNFILRLGHHTLKSWQEYSKAYRDDKSWDPAAYRQSRGLNDSRAGEPHATTHNSKKVRSEVHTSPLSDREKELLAENSRLRQDNEDLSTAYAGLQERFDDLELRFRGLEAHLGRAKPPREDSNIKRDPEHYSPSARAEESADVASAPGETVIVTETAGELKPGDAVMIKDENWGDKWFLIADRPNENGEVLVIDSRTSGTGKYRWVSPDQLEREEGTTVESAEAHTTTTSAEVVNGAPISQTETTIETPPARNSSSRFRRSWNRTTGWLGSRVYFGRPPEGRLVRAVDRDGTTVFVGPEVVDEYEEYDRRRGAAIILGAAAVAGAILAVAWPWGEHEEAEGSNSQQTRIESLQGKVNNYQIELRSKDAQLKALKADEARENGGSLQGEPEGSGQNEPGNEGSEIVPGGSGNNGNEPNNSGNESTGPGTGNGKAHIEFKQPLERPFRTGEGLPKNLHKQINLAGNRASIVDDSGNVIVDHLGHDRQGNLDKQSKELLMQHGYKLRQVRISIRDNQGNPTYRYMTVVQNP